MEGSTAPQSSFAAYRIDSISEKVSASTESSSNRLPLKCLMISAVLLGRSLLKGEGLAGRITIGRTGMSQQLAQVQKVLLRGGPL